jgi:hypothetical protein
MTSDPWLRPQGRVVNQKSKIFLVFVTTTRMRSALRPLGPQPHHPRTSGSVGPPRGYAPCVRRAGCSCLACSVLQVDAVYGLVCAVAASCAPPLDICSQPQIAEQFTLLGTSSNYGTTIRLDKTSDQQRTQKWTVKMNMSM